jgi:glutamate racemase
MARPDQPLLILDSGVGGLSVLKEVRALLPQAPLVYVADNAGYPYGQKDPAALTTLVTALLGKLALRFDPALIVIACNTASTIALEPVRAALHVPIVGTVPAIKPAAAQSRTRAIGVLGTASTIVQPYVDNLARDFAADCLVLRYGTHDLVELAEAKLRGEATVTADYAKVLDGLLSQPGGDRLDTIVLACTHFPLVREELAAAAPRPLAFVDGAKGIARRVQWLLRDHVWPDSPAEGRAVYTAPFPTLDAYRPGFAGFGLPRLEILRK